jgi:CcmD family protein
MNRGLVTLLFLIFNTSTIFGQEKVEMADQLRSDGKIYVVVAIIVIILTGLFIYLFSMDKKVKNLEKLLSEKKKETN